MLTLDPPQAAAKLAEASKAAEAKARSDKEAADAAAAKAKADEAAARAAEAAAKATNDAERAAAAEARKKADQAAAKAAAAKAQADEKAAAEATKNADDDAKAALAAAATAKAQQEAASAREDEAKKNEAKAKAAKGGDLPGGGGGVTFRPPHVSTPSPHLAGADKRAKAAKKAKARTLSDMHMGEPMGDHYTMNHGKKVRRPVWRSVQPATLFTAPLATLGSSGAGYGWGRGLCCQALRPSSGSSTWSRASARSPSARKHARPPPSPGRSSPRS